MKKLKPIHKFNNGNGATLCNECSVIINVGFSDEVLCEECKIKHTFDSENHSDDYLNDQNGKE